MERAALIGRDNDRMTETYTAPLRDFLKHESAGGIVLIAAALLAMVLANSPASGAYFGALQLPISISVGSASLEKPLLLWINDALMAVLFFLVGLEVKREVLEGQLSTWGKASLPLLAAVGGMAMPALIFILVNAGAPDNLRGWAIPAATDIAFALGVLSLLGPRVPIALKALLLAVAVIDDIGAILIIALFYSGQLDLAMLAGTAVTFAFMFVLNRLRVASTVPYILLSLVLWFFVLKSGVHATLAGVAAALTIPTRGGGSSRPSETLEHDLHPWVAFLIIPIFGLANAGVSLIDLEPGDLFTPLPLGIALGLLLGKQIGVFGFAWLAVKAGFATLPSGVSWRQVHAMSLLSAIGFTMSLFIGGLAFSEPTEIEAAKLGVLAGSVIAAIAGYVLLRRAAPPSP